MNSFKNLLLIFLSAALIQMPVNAQNKKKKKKTQSQRSIALTPQEQLKKFKVPQGFIVELVASEENGLINPIDLAFDPAGRLWTGTARMYPLDPVGSVGRKMLEQLQNSEIGDSPQFQKMRDLYQRKIKGTDQILVITNPTKKVQGQIPVFAEGMTIPQSFIPYKGGVYVAHGSEMLYLSDQDNNGKADKQSTILTGFGFTDTHTMSHSLVRGPGGWIHFSHGALNLGKVTAVKSGETATINYSKIARFSLDGNHLEILNNGLNNIWGFKLKANGQWYGTEANDINQSLVPMHPFMGFKGIGSERLRPYQPFSGAFHKFKVGGTGLSGLAFDENGSRGFPKEWKNAGFLANPITSKINAVIADRKPDGSVISKRLPDFLVCEDDWFRPVNLEFGPDGCLYIVDWYNKIVSHNEVSRDHPDRDRTKGRIWRVRHESQTPTPIPNIAQAANKDLLKHLQAEILWEKRSAWTEIVDRRAKELTPDLIKLASNPSLDTASRIHALWSLEGLGEYNLNLLQAMVADSDPDIKREALRSLETFKPSLDDILSLTKPLINSSHYMVKEQVLRTLGAQEKTNNEILKMLIASANPQTEAGKDDTHSFGDSYEPNFQSFLALLALEKHPSELQLFLQSAEAKKLPQGNINEATKTLPKDSRGSMIVASIINGTAQLDGKTLAAIAPSMSSPQILEPLQEQINTKKFLETALTAQANLVSSDLHTALTPILKKLITSTNTADQQLAISSAIKFQHPGINAEIASLISNKALSAISDQEFDALCIKPRENSSLFKQIVANAETNYSQKTRAALSIALADNKKGITALSQLYLKGNDTQQQSMISVASNYQQGLFFLLNLLQQEKINTQNLSLDIQSMMVELHPRHTYAEQLLEQVSQAKSKQSKEGDAKVEKLATAINSLQGNASTGKFAFASCLQCHQAGTSGQNIAPSLDGSKNRDLKHMLTAIVKPNDAIEGGYRVYRIVKQTGLITEGYMYNKTGNGTTIAFMGGSTAFVPKEQILKENHVDGKSFMIPAFGNFSEQQMADLIAYIKTIK